MREALLWAACVLLAVLAGACQKKPPVAAAPPPKPAAAKPARPALPVISEFSAEPRAIERGQSAELRWQVKDATEITIDRGVGSVAASGRRRISPEDSTTYTLLAKGPGGEAAAEAFLTVALPAPPAPAPAAPAASLSERLSKEVQDALIDFDKSDLRSDARAALAQDAAALNRD